MSLLCPSKGRDRLRGFWSPVALLAHVLQCLVGCEWVGGHRIASEICRLPKSSCLASWWYTCECRLRCQKKRLSRLRCHWGATSSTILQGCGEGRVDVRGFGDVVQCGGSVRQFTRNFCNGGALLNMKGAWCPMAGKSSQSNLDHMPSAEPVPEVDGPDSPCDVPALSALCQLRYCRLAGLKGCNRAGDREEIWILFANPKMPFWDKIAELRPLVMLPPGHRLGASPTASFPDHMESLPSRKKPDHIVRIICGPWHAVLLQEF